MEHLHKDLFNALTTYIDMFTFVPSLNKMRLNICFS